MDLACRKRRRTSGRRRARNDRPAARRRRQSPRSRSRPRSPAPCRCSSGSPGNGNGLSIWACPSPDSAPRRRRSRRCGWEHPRPWPRLHRIATPSRRRRRGGVKLRSRQARGGAETRRKLVSAFSAASRVIFLFQRRQFPLWSAAATIPSPPHALRAQRRRTADRKWRLRRRGGHGDADRRLYGSAARGIAAHPGGLGPYRRGALSWRQRRAVRRAAGRGRRRGRRADDPQCRGARSAASPPRPCRSAPPQDGAEADACLRGAGLPADLDLLALSGRPPAGARQRRRLGREQRRRLLQFRARRADQSLWRLPRHLLRPDRPRPRLWAAPAGKPPRHPGRRLRRPSSIRCWAPGTARRSAAPSASSQDCRGMSARTS